jgi:hypothetical protein
MRRVNQDERLKKFIEESVASMFCEKDIEKLGYRDLKKIQMQGMWKGIEKAEEKGILVRKLPVSEAWDYVQKFVEKPEELKPFCPVPEKKKERR